MAKKTYTKMEVRVAARPRSERLRSAGASSTSGNAMSSPALLDLKATVDAHVADSSIHVTEDEKTLWNLVASLFGVDEDGNVYVKGDRGFYGTSFISSHGLDPEAGGAGVGLDIDELWSVLGAAGTEKIDASHIPALDISAITGLQDALDSKLEGITKGMVEAVLTGTVTSHDHDGRYAPLSDGLIPSQYLPGFVDDVLEYPSAASFPDAGESGKIYVALDTNLAYRWGGSGYVEISPSLALGHTSSTAYPGDEGAANAAAIQTLQGRFTGGAANKVAHSLTIVHDGGSTSASDKTFDGSAAVTVSIPTTLPASDVYAWAKASTKPSYMWSEIGSKPTTLEGYGITDGVNEAEAGGHLTASVSGHSLSVGVASGYALPSSTQITLWNKIASLFDIDADGNVYVTGDRGFYSNSFVSARGSDSEAGSGAGGLDVDELWSVLGASGTEKIDASHIPALQQLSGTLTNAQLANSAISVAGVSVSLGGAVSTAQIASALTAAGYKLTDTIYTLPKATVSALGGVKAAGVRTSAITTTQGGTASGRYYGVELDSNGKAFVNVPWVNTTYTLSSFGITATAAELNKLDGLATTKAELGYLHGVTSAVQTQLNGKLNNGSTTYGTAYARNFVINNVTCGLWVTANPSSALGPFFAPSSAGRSGSILQATGGVPGWIPRSALTQQLFTVNGGCVHIPEDSDLNDYTTPGLYSCWANATVQTLANSPTTGAFSLVVLQTAGVIQILREYGYSYNANEYTRRYYNGNWTVWMRAPRLNELYTKAEADGRYLQLAGGTLTGDIVFNGARLILGAGNQNTGANFIYSVVETGGALAGFFNGMPFFGSIGASTTKALHFRSVTGHATIGTSFSATYNVLDTGNYTSYTLNRDAIVSTIGVSGTDLVGWTYNGNVRSKVTQAQLRTMLGLGSNAYTSTAYLPQSSYTAADVLAKLKTVDGAGSGLDADLLDGTHKSGLLTSVASTSAANLSVTVGGTAKVVADLYATYLEGNPATSFDLSTNLGVCQDYGCYVIGLMQITDYTIVGNHANGELILIRQNGNNPTAKIIYSLSTKYNTTDVRFGHLVLGFYSTYVTPCTFTYNGKKWAGFNVAKIVSNYTQGVVCKRDGLRLCEKSAPFLLKYKVSNTGEVLNSEVNGSLVVNGSDIIEGGVSTSRFVGALTGIAESATKLATVRTLWGKSFDGTANVSGDMTGVDWINSAILVSLSGSIDDGTDMVRLQGRGHVLEFGGTGYAHKTYYFRPLYGSSGATNASMYIQNASAAASPTFTTTHSFLSTGVAYHSGRLGIGTPNPAYMLHVTNTGYFGGALRTASDMTVNGNLTVGQSLKAYGHVCMYASTARLIMNAGGTGFMTSMENGNWRLMTHNVGNFSSRLFEMTPSGNAAFGGSPSSSYRLYVVGDLGVTGYSTMTGIRSTALVRADAGVQIGSVSDIGWYNRSNRIAAGSSTARGVNVGDLLVSNAWADMTKVPTNGIYSKGAVLTDSYIQVGSGRLRWDAANNALYVEKSDGTACGLYATGFLSSHDADPGAGTAAGADTGAAVPQYDLLRPRRLASQTCYEGSVTDTTVSPNRVLTVSDQPPMLRFRGGKPGDGWSVEVYVRTSGGKNSKYRRVLTAPMSECTGESGWKNTVYESVVLPWSLMRIFFEKFDPTAGRFHSTPYVGATVGSAWADLVANSHKGSGVTSFTSIEKKRWDSSGGDGGEIRSQASCLYAYAHFGVRLANDTLGVHGDMKTFTISLRKATSSNLGDNDLSFTMRTD